MPVKIIVDLSVATELEIEEYMSAARDAGALNLFNNSRKHGLEFIQLADSETALRYYTEQAFPSTVGEIIVDELSLVVPGSKESADHLKDSRKNYVDKPKTE